MKKNSKKLAAMAVVGTSLAVALAGCETPTKQTTGAVAGGAIGGLLGSQIGGGSGRIIATGVGVLAGSLLGASVGRSLDRADRQAAYNAEVRALEYGRTGAPVAWRNNQSGHYGQVVPGQRYKVNSLDCRDYVHTIYIDGNPETARGRACRQPDGTWRPV